MRAVARLTVSALFGATAAIFALSFGACGSSSDRGASEADGGGADGGDAAPTSEDAAPADVCVPVQPSPVGDAEPFAFVPEAGGPAPSALTGGVASVSTGPFAFAEDAGVHSEIVVNLVDRVIDCSATGEPPYGSILRLYFSSSQSPPPLGTYVANEPHAPEQVQAEYLTHGQGSSISQSLSGLGQATLTRVDDVALEGTLDLTFEDEEAGSFGYRGSFTSPVCPPSQCR